MTSSQTPWDTWTVYGGDLAVTLRAPSPWGRTQRAYLGGYLPGKLGDRDLGGFELTVHPAGPDDPTSAWLDGDPPVGRRFEPVPGVAMLERHDELGRPWYTVVTDTLEHQAGVNVVRVHDDHIDLYLRPSATRPHSYPLRLIREAMLRSYENLGGVVFHAAGLDINGHGVMICGPRSSGKTTTLTALLKATGGALLSNDRIILDVPDRMVAVPLPVPVAREAIEATPELRQALLTAARPQPDLADLPPGFGATTKAEFSALEYATALGARLAAGSWLRTIVAARLTNSSEPARADRLTTRHARDLLTENCFTPRDEFWREPWLVARTSPDSALAAHAQRVVDRIAASVPCVEVRFGVHSPPQQLTDTLAGLLRGAS